MSSHNVYISHAWGGESEQIVREIYKRCRKAGLNVVLDRKDLGYRESISSFMKDLGRADAIILVVSNKYLHSEYCMYELLQIYENQDIISRIFPIVLDEVSIAKSTERLDLVKYWENETDNLESKIRELKNLTYIEGITDDLNLYQKIRNNIAKLTKILKDINTLNIRLHKENDYNQLISSIQTYLARTDTSGLSAGITGEGEPVNQNPGPAGSPDPDFQTNSMDSPEPGQRKGWISKFFRVWPLALLLVTVAALVYSWTGSQQKGDHSQLNPISENEKNRDMDFENTDEAGLDNQVSQEKPHFTMTEPASRQPDNKSEVTASGSVPAHIPDPTSRYPGQNSTTSVPPNRKTEFASVPPQNTVPSSDSESLIGPSDGIPDPARNENVLISQAQDEPSPEIAEGQPRFRSETVMVLPQSISVRIPENISSNTAKEGDVIYLENLVPVSSEGQMVAEAGARVRTRIIDARPSFQGSRGSLGVRLEAVETIDGQWLDVSYHDIIERKRMEIVFQAGTEFDRVELKETTITLKVIQ